MKRPTSLSGQICSTPLRKANTRGSTQITGTVFSAKMKGPIDRIGPYELRFVIRAELDPRVSRILYQPVRYDIPDENGVIRSAYPDFLIEIDGVEEIHEIKSDVQYARPSVRRQLEDVALAAAKLGHRYSVTLGSSLHRKTDEAAIDAVWRRMGEPVAPKLLFAVD